MLSVFISISHNHIKPLFKALIVFIGCFLATQISSAQTSYTLIITPESGPPGTTIFLVPNPTYTDERCFAGGQQLAGRSYTVPTDASGRIGFHCEAGSGEFLIRTDTVVFYIIPPDMDGDGIPDSLLCPTMVDVL